MPTDMKTRLRPVSLRFDTPELEAAYLTDAFSDYALPLRYALFIGVALYGGFVWVDRYLFGAFVDELLVNRAIVCTLATGLLGLTLHPAFPRYVRPYMAVLHVAVGLGAIHMSTLHPSYEGGLYASFAYFPLLARAQFQFSTALNGLLLLFFAALRTREFGLAEVIVDVSMLFSAVVVFGLGAYLKERAARVGFLQKRALSHARDQALGASRAKSTFLANMSHELRTPLNAIIGYGEMLQEDLQDAGNEEPLPDLEKIVVSGRHLLGLINDILDLSKIEAGKVELLSQEFDVSKLIDSVAGTVEPLVKKRENRLTVSAAKDLGLMCSDATRVRQILLNLLSNAAKFTQGGSIELSARREARDDGDRIVFRVTDTGIGMTSDQQGRIFDAFHQAESSTARDYGGTGLGLTITKHFSEMLRGSISVESEPGAGTTFEVWLPAEFEPVPRSGEPTSAPPSDRSRTRVSDASPHGKAR